MDTNSLNEQELLDTLRHEGFDVALICNNGHEINIFATMQTDRNQKYCIECGAKTIFKCDNCGQLIKGGRLLSLQHWVDSEFSFPNFCRHCGAPYFWMASKLNAAKELAEEISSLSSAELEQLKNSIDDIVTDTPKTSVAAIRFKKYALSGGKEIASAFKDILVDVVSETAKKMIWPNG